MTTVETRELLDYRAAASPAEEWGERKHLLQCFPGCETTTQRHRLRRKGGRVITVWVIYAWASQGARTE